VIEMRRTRETDLAIIYAWYRDPETAKRAGCFVADNYSEFALHYRSLLDSTNARCYVLCQGGECVGLAEIRAIGGYSGTFQGEAVLWLGSKRGVGLGICAIALLLEQAFEVENLDRLWWWVDRRNAAMLTVCLKLGFREVLPDTVMTATTRYFEISRNEYDLFVDHRVLVRYHQKERR